MSRSGSTEMKTGCTPAANKFGPDITLKNIEHPAVGTGQKCQRRMAYQIFRIGLRVAFAGRRPLNQFAIIDAEFFCRRPDLGRGSGQANESWMEITDIIGEDLGGVARGVDGNEDRLHPGGKRPQIFEQQVHAL